MVVFMWISLTITAVCWLYSWRVFAKLRGVPAGLNAPENGPKISIVIPARNEESNLAVLLPTLLSQTYSAHEIIVVDDASDDKTAHVAEKSGARVIKNKPLPEDWFGKQWACYNGAAEAEGEWLLFLDADTSLESEALEKFAALSENAQVGSLCLSVSRNRKNPMKNSLRFFNAIMILGSNAFTTESDKATETGLFGQALFVRKSDYDAIDGHASVKRDLPENFVMARHFAKIGLTCRCYLGRGIAKMRMYPTNLTDLIAGWGKGFVSGAGETPKSALLGISMWPFRIDHEHSFADFSHPRRAGHGDYDRGDLSRFCHSVPLRFSKNRNLLDLECDLFSSGANFLPVAVFSAQSPRQNPEQK